MNTKQLLSKVLCCSLVIFSCSSSDTSVYLRVKDVEGINIKSPITVNGFLVGQVKSIDLDRNGSIVIRANIDKDILIPKDSKFSIETLDFFGSKGITVELGNSSSSILKGDTIDIVGTKLTPTSDSLTSILKDVFKTVTGVEQQDSILNELKRLNKNLEKIQK